MLFAIFISFVDFLDMLFIGLDLLLDLLINIFPVIVYLLVLLL